MGWHKRDQKEIDWAMGVIQKHGGGVSHQKVEDEGIYEEYKAKFGKRITSRTLSNWLYRLARKDKPVSGGSFSKAMRVFKLANKSKYLIFTFDGRMLGFETEKEVTAMLEENKVLGGIKVFKSLDVNIKYSVELGK